MNRSRKGVALGPVTLVGEQVRLEPLRLHHREGLLRAAQEERIWAWLGCDLRGEEAMEAFFREAEAEESAGTSYAFAVIGGDPERILGSTRYLDVVPAARGVEIGWTWYAPEVWGTRVNPEAKLLLMQHAFEEWGAIRVCLKTDERNVRSRAAISKLGARSEGILRNHRIRPDGSYRDSAYYSVIESEWPDVKARLQERLAGMGGV